MWILFDSACADDFHYPKYSVTADDVHERSLTRRGCCAVGTLHNSQARLPECASRLTYFILETSFHTWQPVPGCRTDHTAVLEKSCVFVTESDAQSPSCLAADDDAKILPFPCTRTLQSLNKGVFAAMVH